MIDPIRVVESAYGAGDATEAEWLDQLVASIASNVPSFAGTTLAYTYDVRDDGWVAVRSFVERGPTPLGQMYLALGEIDVDLQADLGRLHLESGIASVLIQLQRYVASGTLRPFYERGSSRTASPTCCWCARSTPRVRVA